MKMSVFEYSNKEEYLFKTKLSYVGKTSITTFYSDLSIADYYSKKAVKETYSRVVKEWISNLDYILEFCLVLNWKAWRMNDLGNTELSVLYSELYYKCLNKIHSRYKDKESKQKIFEYLD